MHQFPDSRSWRQALTDDSSFRHKTIRDMKAITTSSHHDDWFSGGSLVPQAISCRDAPTLWLAG